MVVVAILPGPTWRKSLGFSKGIVYVSVSNSMFSVCPVSNSMFSILGVCPFATAKSAIVEAGGTVIPVGDVRERSDDSMYRCTSAMRAVTRTNSDGNSFARRLEVGLWGLLIIRGIWGGDNRPNEGMDLKQLLAYLKRA